MSNIPSNAPYRADIVGSFLRPAELKEARKQFTEGKIDRRQLKAVEDRLITDLIAKQKAHGLKVITDGEFRRSYWHLDFMWGFNGIEEIELEHGYQFHGEETTPGSIRLTGRISGENHPFVEHFRFVKQFEEEGITARQTLPAPAQLLAELYRGDNTKNTEAVYPDFDLLLHDIAEAYRQVIADLYAAGCRNIQFDDCTWGMIVDKDYWKAREGDHATLESEAEKYLKINNLALEGRPADIAFTTHICRGNYHSTYACRGAYDPVAPFVFAQENVDAFYLEYDDERSGGFEPLKYFAENPHKGKIVLGLISSKFPQLENKDSIKARIAEAAKYVPLEQLCLSPQCGFASTEEGNIMSEAQQWMKVRYVEEIAKEVWGEK